MKKLRCLRLGLTAALAISLSGSASFTQGRLHEGEQGAAKDRPWMNPQLSPDERAEMVLKELTLDEKIDLVHGEGMPGWHGKVFPKAYLGNGGAGFVFGVERLGIPMIQMSDAAYGVRTARTMGDIRRRCRPPLLPRRAGIPKRRASMAR